MPFITSVPASSTMRKLSIDPFAYILFALLLLSLPFRWVLAAITAAAIHELFHISAVFLLGGSLQHMEVGVRCASIHSGPMSPLHSVICSAAGPVGSLLLLILFRPFPRIAICGFIQGFFNLLPLFPLDGGRMVLCILNMIFSEKHAFHLYHILEIITLFLLSILCMWLSFSLKVGITPFFIFLFLLLHKNSLQTGKSQGTIVLPMKKR